MEKISGISRRRGRKGNKKGRGRRGRGEEEGAGRGKGGGIERDCIGGWWKGVKRVTV